MTFFDPRHPERMTPEQQAQYQEFLKAYPQLASKMDTSRQLNTPLVEAVNKGEVQGRPLPRNKDGTINHAAISGDELPDLEEIEAEQKAERPYRDRPLGTMQIDTHQPRSLTEEDREELEYKERLKRRMREERLEQEEYEAAGGFEEPPPPPRRAAPPPPPPPPRNNPPPPRDNPPKKKKEVKFSTQGKRHPVLLRMRQSLGLEDLERNETIVISDVHYTMKRLMREDVARAVSLATYKVTDESMLRSYIETSIVAHAIVALDGEDTATVFDVPLRDYNAEKGREEVLSVEQRKQRAVREMFDFLIESPTELTDTLVVFYEQNFPAVNFMPEGTSLALCPVANCTHRAITPLSEERYCPIHGQKLHREETLPNPS